MSGTASSKLVAWLPTVTMMLVNVLSYVDRNTLALLAPTILRDTGLSNQQYGFVISAFSITYMICNPVWGRIVDRIGARSSMNAAALFWTLASVSHAMARGFGGFFAARTALAVGEAASYPAALRTVVQTLPATWRMRGISVVFSGGSLGAIVTPIVITPVAAGWGWKGAFWFTGALGAAWLALWNVVSRRSSMARPAREAAASGGGLRWNDPRVWAFMSLNALGAYQGAFVLYLSSLYLSAALHKSQIEIGRMLWIPPLGWEMGFFFWGWVTERSSRASSPPSTLRWQFGVMVMLSLPLAALPYTDSYAATMALFFLAMFMAASFTVGSLAYATQHYSTSHSGLIAGVSSASWSAVIALVLPVAGRLFDGRTYPTAFALAAGLTAAAYVLWLALDWAGSKRTGTGCASSVRA
jgi:ACS family hexuronate transporter-like MFS transporter